MRSIHPVELVHMLRDCETPKPIMDNVIGDLMRRERQEADYRLEKLKQQLREAASAEPRRKPSHIVIARPSNGEHEAYLASPLDPRD